MPRLIARRGQVSHCAAWQPRNPPDDMLSSMNQIRRPRLEDLRPVSWPLCQAAPVRQAGSLFQRHQGVRWRVRQAKFSGCPVKLRVRRLPGASLQRCAEAFQGQMVAPQAGYCTAHRWLRG